MKSIHSKSFLDTWRLVYGETNPQQRNDRWRVDDVEWTRETHSYIGHDYSFRMDIHNLRRMHGNKVLWSLLVVQERWWNKQMTEAIRIFEWRRALAGKDRDILAWFTAQRDLLTGRHSSH
jgi:hypothetical protein